MTKYELSNLNRQIIYNESDIGFLKSEAAENKILQFLPNNSIQFINKKISSSEDIAKLIMGNDIVITAIDQPRHEIMDWFNLACVKSKIPFICGALDSRLAMCYTIYPGNTGCIECWKASSKQSGLVFQELIQHKNFKSPALSNVAIMPFISIVSGLVVNELLKIQTGIAKPQSLGKLSAYDFLSSEIKIIETWEKNSNCPICSKTD